MARIFTENQIHEFIIVLFYPHPKDFFRFISS